MVKRVTAPPPLEERGFESPDEIDFAIKKLERRIADLQALNVEEAVLNETGAEDVVRSDVRAAIREVFGQNSPEFKEHEHLRIWAGGMYVNMSQGAIIEGRGAA